MNETEQRQRHVAVATAERRIDDLELLVNAMSAALVEDHDGFEAKLNSADRVRERYALETRQRLDGIAGRQLLFESMTFWQRCKWLFMGEIV